jgi:hypothetical protein
MSINTTKIRAVSVVGGGDLAITPGSNNLRACWWSASGEVFINIAVKPTVFSQGR